MTKFERMTEEGPDSVLAENSESGLDELEKLRRQNEKLKRVARMAGDKKRQLKDLVLTDELTGLLNKRGLEKEITNIFDQLTSRNYNRMGIKIERIGLAVIDMDELKKINDTYGHNVGDQAIVRLAAFLKGKLRSRDIIGRCGEKADEFILIFPDADENILRIRLSEIQQLASNLFVLSDKGISIPLKFSVGFFAVNKKNCCEGMTSKQAIKLAEQDMYSKKREKTGRGDEGC